MKKSSKIKQDINGEFGYPLNDDEEPDIDPYLGIMPPSKPHKKL